MPGSADKGPPLAVFLVAGAFPNEHQFSIRGPFTGDGVGATGVQGAVGATLDQGSYFIQRVHYVPTSQNALAQELRAKARGFAGDNHGLRTKSVDELNSVTDEVAQLG